MSCAGGGGAPSGFSRHRGFTLVELVVVCAIMAVLMSILLPALSAVRTSANEMQCASNMRQIAQALILYATDNNNWFPPNVSTPASKARFWYDADRIGTYLPDSGPTALAGTKGGVMICPSDANSYRSYAMNYWASSDADPNVLSASPTRGRLWTPADGNASSALLLVERWSTLGGTNLGGWVAPPTAGANGNRSGPRFGGGTGVPTFSLRYGFSPCDLPYPRHRRGMGRPSSAAVGRLNFGYMDGHVAMKSNAQLVDQATGLSTLDSWWTPIDPELNK